MQAIIHAVPSVENTEILRAVGRIRDLGSSDAEDTGIERVVIFKGAGWVLVRREGRCVYLVGGFGRIGSVRDVAKDVRDVMPGAGEPLEAISVL